MAFRRSGSSPADVAGSSRGLVPCANDIEEILARDALLLPLFHEQATRFVRPDIEGLVIGFNPEVSYEMLTIRR